MSGPDTALKCPSAQPDMPDAIVLGVAAGSPAAPQLAYLNEVVPATPELMREAGDVDPREVFRFAARCEQSRCLHFENERCRLASRIVAMLEPAADKLPPCVIRPTCRWYKQEGAAACHRCPQIVTKNAAADDRVRRVAADPRALPIADRPS